MLLFKDLQSTVQSIVAADTMFAQQLVVSDVGLQQRQMESVLSLAGFCIAVSPPLSAGAKDAAQGVPQSSAGAAGVLNARIIVTIRTNPTRNPAPANPALNPPDVGGANINIYAAITEVVRVLKSWTPPESTREKPFDLDGEDAILLVPDDPGNFSYDLRFSKAVIV